MTLAFADTYDAAILRSVRQLPGVLAVEPMRSAPVILSAGPRSQRDSLFGIPADARLNRVLDGEAAGTAAHRRPDDRARARAGSSTSRSATWCACSPRTAGAACSRSPGGRDRRSVRRCAGLSRARHLNRLLQGLSASPPPICWSTRAHARRSAARSTTARDRRGHLCRQRRGHAAPPVQRGAAASAAVRAVLVADGRRRRVLVGARHARRAGTRPRDPARVSASGAARRPMCCSARSARCCSPRSRSASCRVPSDPLADVTVRDRTVQLPARAEPRGLWPVGGVRRGGGARRGAVRAARVDRLDMVGVLKSRD